MLKLFLMKKGIAIGIILLFIFGCCTPGLTNSSILKKDQQISLIGRTDENAETTEVTCVAFGKTHNLKETTTLSQDDISIIFELLQELKSEMMFHPFSENTQSLKQMLVDLLDEKGLLGQGESKDTYLSCLNPRWVIRLQEREDTSSSPQPLTDHATCSFCSVSGEGVGVLFPLVEFPRPRLFMRWIASDGLTSAANLFTSNGYIAVGQQTGFTLGFTGIGISYAVPGYTLYAFIGYALQASTTAEYFEHYPPNSVPEISDIEPLDGEQNVPLNLPELQFQIQDADGDLMSYTVMTEPNIGSGSGDLKLSGVYTVPVSGLTANSLYKWTVEVTDGIDITNQQFSFSTIVSPFNPFDEGWQYRKEISIDHSKISGILSTFPVFIHTLDADLHAKAQPDGDDILFMDGPGVAYKLNHEIESYETSNGELLVWVNIMNLKADENTVIYMYYGNPDIANGQMCERVWNPYFTGIWHLNDFQDSTKNRNHGSNSGSVACSGKLGDAREFDGSDDYILVDDDPSLNFHIPNRFSISLWIKRDRSNTYESVISKCTSSLKAGYAVQILENNSILFVMCDGSQEYQSYSNKKITDTNWYYITVVWDGTQQYIYIDGVLDNSITIGDITIADDSKPLEFGHHYGYLAGQNPFGGSIDEIQLSKINRTADWILTSYRNQQNPFTFMTFGTEEPHP